jgi:hypothetical protein
MVGVSTNEAKEHVFSCSGYLCSSLRGRSLGRRPLGMSMKSYLGKLIVKFLATKGQILRFYTLYFVCVKSAFPACIFKDAVSLGVLLA